MLFILLPVLLSFLSKIKDLRSIHTFVMCYFKVYQFYQVLTTSLFNTPNIKINTNDSIHILIRLLISVISNKPIYKYLEGK